MEHLSEQSIAGYRQRKLAPAELLAVDDHLTDCQECHQRVTEGNPYLVKLGRLGYELSTLPVCEDDHLSYEQLAALVDNETDEVDREIITVHLEVCEQCKDELRSLQELNEPVAVAESADHQSGKRLRERLFLRLAWPKFAFAVLVALIAVALVWVVWRALKVGNVEVANTNVPAASPASSPLTSPSAPPISVPQILVTLNDAGGKVTLDEAGKIEGLGDLSSPLSASLKSVLTNERLNIGPAIAELNGKGGTLMGTSSEGVPFRLVGPVGVVVRDDRPTFRWEPLKGASAYVVKVYDDDFKEVTRSLSQPATSWRVAIPLPRGVIYIWQVTASKDGEEIKSPTAPAPEARFKVLSREKEVEIERLHRTHANSHLVLGTIYAEAGLIEDAQREFRLLQKANPGSPVVQKLLQALSRPNAGQTK